MDSFEEAYERTLIAQASELTGIPPATLVGLRSGALVTIPARRYEYDGPRVIDPELLRMAEETARDAREAALCLLEGGAGSVHFGVQHVGGRIKLTISVAPKNQP